MPVNVEADLNKLRQACEKKISDFAKVVSVNIVPIAFGLKALEFILMAEEEKGGTEKLEKELKNLADVSSVDILDVRRAVG